MATSPFRCVPDFVEVCSKDIPCCKIEKSGSYTGSANNPRINLTYNGKSLVKGTDYNELSWNGDRIHPGNHTIHIEGTGNFIGTKTATYTIEEAELTDISVVQTDALTYNCQSQIPQVEAAAIAQGGQAVTFWYCAEENGTYGEMPGFIDAGEHTVYYKASAAYHKTTKGSFQVTIAKQEVTPPIIESKVFNNQSQTADLPESAFYTVTRNNGGTNAGEYDVILRLTTPDNYKWPTTEAQDLTLKFTITPAENQWTEEPTISGWVYGETADPHMGAAKYGASTVKYVGINNNYEGYAAPTQAGRYKAVFTVPATSNYRILEKEVIFDIAPKALTEVTAALADADQERDYNGREHCAEPIVRSGETILQKGTHYALAYANNVNAGTATVTVNPTDNYDFEPVTLEFKINKIDPMVQNFTFTPPANLVYDGTAKEAKVGYNYPENHTGLGEISLKYYDAEGKEVQPINVGTYTVKAFVAEGQNFNAFETDGKNARVISLDWSFSIQKASPSFNFEAKDKTYDATTTAEVVLVPVEGLAEKDVLTAGTDYIITGNFEDANVGIDKNVTYTVTWKDTAVLANYNLPDLFPMVTADITRAPLTITADSYTVKVGSDKPSFTYTTNGLLGTDQLTTAPTLSCTADMDKIGDYVIAVSDAVADNYSITYVNGKLMVREEFSVKTEVSSGGKATVSAAKAMEGEIITVKVEPKKHYKLKSLEVTDANGKQITVTQDEKGNYCFSMPDSDVKVTVKFKVKYTSIADSTNPKTGDFSLVFWSGMMATTMLGAAALLSKKKYFEQ